PLGELLDLNLLLQQVGRFRHHAAAPLFVVGAFVLGGLLVVPVTLLVVVAALAFGTVLGFLYGLAGALASAVTVYAIGRWAGRDVVRRLAGARLNRISRRLAQRGILAIL